MDPERFFPFADGYPFGPPGRVAPAGGGGGGSTQFARPISDISITGYFPTPSGSCFAVLDEVSPDDADYIQSNVTGATAQLQLTSLTDPGFDTDHTLSFRGADVAVGSQALVCDLYCGATLIQSVGLPGVASPTTVSVGLIPANVANITDYTNLQVLLRDDMAVVKGAQRRIYWVELKVGP